MFLGSRLSCCCCFYCCCRLPLVAVLIVWYIAFALEDVYLDCIGKMQTDFEAINLSELADAEIVERMRHCNYEKYKTLVRMHLSFELDLNTDEFDLPCHEIAYEDKGKLKKWNRLSKKHKSTVSSTMCAAKSAGNSPTEGLNQQIDPGFMFHLKEMKEFLMSEKNLHQEGLFRKTGALSRQNELRLQIQNERPLNLEASGYSAHDCASVFKSYLAELTEPLLTDAHYPAHLQIAPLCIGRSFNVNNSTLTRPPNPERIKREQRLLHSMQLLILLLPDENRKLLEHIIEILYAVASFEHINKMSADNLATIFTPHLICPRNLPPEALHYLAKKLCSIIAYMITKGADIFQVPSKLSTDIRAYFLERKRKKTMSPEQTLDESISDISTVNTVYTFVDRERTAKCNTKNTTDTELAQLYAHIQSLPESSKKRRLIKQFNKQNGQGTPLQLVIMNRLKNSEATRSAKSFGDSIKKHIFHKSIISRTPKRSTATTPVGIETPNYSHTKQPKLRVLFQSPSTSSANTTPEKLHGKLSKIVTNTSHPFQKSISSSSLLLNASVHVQQSMIVKQHNDENETSSSCSSSTNSNDGLPKHILRSVSAPVSRQCSNDLPNKSSSVTLNNSNSSTLSLTSTTSSQNFQSAEANCCATSLKIISEAARQLIVGGGGGVVVVGDATEMLTKKSVGWNDKDHHHHRLHEVDDDKSASLDPNTPNELKLRYKSEPNLSRIFKDKLLDIPETVPEQLHTPILKGTAAANVAGRSLTRKLIKGVSMSNIKFPFSTPESTKRLVRSVSSTLKRRHSDESRMDIFVTDADINVPCCSSSQFMKLPLIENDHHSTFDDNDDDDDDDDEDNDDDDDDLDDETFEDDPNDHVESDSDRNEIDETLDAQVAANSCCSNSSDMPDSLCAPYKQILVQPSGLYRNIDLITSTPSLLLGRRSMSPITKSAQRMPKSMQESIMTPRSRKPVMVLTTTLGSLDQNQTIYQNDLSCFREQDEDSSSAIINQPNLLSEDAISVGSYTELIKQTKSRQTSFSDSAGDSAKTYEDEERQQNVETIKTGVLSQNFKEYLRGRSVLTDSSFSSHPDDFRDDDDDDNDTESDCAPQEIVDLNESQLSPSLLYCLDGNEPRTNADDTEETFSTPRAHISRRSFGNNARKRAATNDTTTNKLMNSPTKSEVTTSNRGSSMTQSVNSSNKENRENVDDFILSKKVLISECPNETSF